MSARAILFDQCGESRRAIYLPPKPLPALGVPTLRSQRRHRPVTVGRTAALLLTISWAPRQLRSPHPRQVMLPRRFWEVRPLDQFVRHYYQSNLAATIQFAPSQGRLVRYTSKTTAADCSSGRPPPIMLPVF